MSSFSTILISTLGGIVPALLWLWFWLKEDKKNPEPKIFITITFIAGIICVPLVIPIEKAIFLNLSNTSLIIILWASAEEIIKFLVGYIVILKRKVVDEPIDSMIYMITIALGFAAIENTLFLLDSMGSGFTMTFTTGSFRFVGATLLHILSSAAIGGAIAFSFYKNKLKKTYYLFIGIILAILIHASFNLLINYFGNEKLLVIFSFVWAGIIFLIIFFEKIRSLKKKRRFQINSPHKKI